MLLPVTTTVWGMEYSVHACPKRHKSEAEAMFPGLDVDDLLIIPTCQVKRGNLFLKYEHPTLGLNYPCPHVRSFAEDQDRPGADGRGR